MIDTPADRRHLTSLSIRVRFEAAHRLPDIDRCRHLHGHSWQAWITVTGHPDPATGMVADFAPLKRAVQGWVDSHLDHAAILGHADPLVDALAHLDLRHYAVGVDEHSHGFEWPTVETIAEVLYNVARTYAERSAMPVCVSQVAVRETENSQAAILHGCPGDNGDHDTPPGGGTWASDSSVEATAVGAGR